jgi:hypothetical protein
MVTSPNVTLTLAAVPVRMAGAAGGALQTAQRIGAAIGTALLASLFYRVLTGSGHAYPVAVSDALLGASALMLLALLLAIAELWQRHRHHRDQPTPTPQPQHHTLVAAIRAVASGHGLIAPEVTRRLIARFAATAPDPARRIVLAGWVHRLGRLDPGPLPVRIRGSHRHAAGVRQVIHGQSRQRQPPRPWRPSRSSKSPCLTPSRNARSSTSLNSSAGPSGCLELRTATPPPGSLAVCTHSPSAVLRWLLRHCTPWSSLAGMPL